MLEKYLAEMKEVLPRHFRPGGVYYGTNGNMRFINELGEGLKGSPIDEVYPQLEAIYNDLYVANLVESNKPYSFPAFVERLLPTLFHEKDEVLTLECEAGKATVQGSFLSKYMAMVEMGNEAEEKTFQYQHHAQLWCCAKLGFTYQR